MLSRIFAERHCPMCMRANKWVFLLNLRCKINNRYIQSNGDKTKLTTKMKKKKNASEPPAM